MARAQVARAADQAADARRVGRVLEWLKREYPEATCSLTFKNPFELLIATILSAQCTDERVNLVTPALFKRFPTPQAMAGSDRGELEKLIQSTGFFRSKAESLLQASRAIVQKHGGQVPRSLEDLTALRGVGRKTANVVRGVAFGVPGLVVDTHVGRLSRRLGFTRATDPEKVEQELMLLVPEADWTLFGLLLIYHGRAVCDARKPRCETCGLAKLCPRTGV